MGHASLYNDDILLWSEQQAEVIRKLGQARRDLPNEFDVENVAEEIESVGRSELAAVESQVQNIFVHLMKLVIEPHSEAARHWRGEIVAFHGEATRRYAPSMRQRIDVNRLWERARLQSMLMSETPEQLEAVLPKQSPIQLDELLAEPPDPFALVQAIKDQGTDGTGNLSTEGPLR